MVDYANPLHPHERIAHRDRSDAVDALARARDEGRLTAGEFEERSAAAQSAVTWSDLTPLFVDLPREPNPVQAVGGDWDHRGRALGGGWGATIMAFVPFLALGLFFIGGFVWGGWAWSWLFFLIIPIAGIFIYGPASQYRGRR